MSCSRRLESIVAEIFVVMVAETISLGILSLPSALAAIGIVP